MALFDGILKKKYTATVYCNNCNSHSEVQVPRGVTVAQFIENGPCPSCGCATLIADYKQIDEFKEHQPQPKMQILRPRMTVRARPPVEPRQRAPIPEPRPSMKSRRFKPLPKTQAPNFEPKKIFKQDPVDFWTGKERPARPQDEQPQPQDSDSEEYYTDETY